MRYDAFISYSHVADNVAAPALQRALHSFARPWNRMRALHVFRDQTSLAASPELWPAIEAALGDARWLLLMASPEAAASRWVAREIDWWLTHRSPQTLLIVLTGGAVQWDQPTGDFDWERTTCLPHDAVSKRFPGEPLWVDLSWAKSADVLTLRHARFRQAVLDVAAPLHGRPKDELDGEDVRRFARMQRIRTGVIAALAVLTSAAIAASVIAYLQRNEALRQATIAHAGRLAAQAEQLRERGGATDTSAMLAAEGLRLIDGIGERSADVDQALRRALAGLFEERARLEISANEMRMTPDGARLLATHVANRISVHGALDGKPQGCNYDALRRVRKTAAGERLGLIGAVSDDGAWCVMHVYFEGSKRHALELWSAQPLRQVAQVTLSSRDGHLRPAIAPGGRWLAATDVPQSGEPSAAVVRLWSIGDDGRVGAAQTLPGMTVMAFAPDGRHLATSAGLWRLPERASDARTSGATPRAERRAAWDAMPWRVAFSPDSAHVATQVDVAKVVIWDVADGNDRLRASPPAGELLALGPGGSRIIVASARESTVWDTQLDVARAVLPVRADAAALPGRGEAIFVVEGDVSSGVQRQRVLALAEDPTALAATRFPGAAAGVKRMRFADGVAEFLEVVGADAQDDGSANQRPTANTHTIRLHRLDAATGTWSVASTLEGVTAFALASDEAAFAAAAGGQVIVVSKERDAPPQPLAPPVAVDRLAFSADGTSLLAFAPSGDGGALHLWHRAKGDHWSVSAGARPSAMAVTRDGRFILAVTASGSATRAGESFQLIRWRFTDPADKVTVELGRHLRPPSICTALADREKGTKGAGSGAGGIGVTTADIAGCSDEKPPPAGWRIEAGGTQATAYAPSGAAVARIDHAATILQVALSPDAQEAVTLDESGHVQRFAIEPKALIAQVCRRQPQALSGELRASLPAQVQAIDACGRKAGVEATSEAKP